MTKNRYLLGNASKRVMQYTEDTISNIQEEPVVSISKYISNNAFTTAIIELHDGVRNIVVGRLDPGYRLLTDSTKHWVSND